MAAELKTITTAEMLYNLVCEVERGLNDVKALEGALYGVDTDGTIGIPNIAEGRDISIYSTLDYIMKTSQDTRERINKLRVQVLNDYPCTGVLR